MKKLKEKWKKSWNYAKKMNFFMIIMTIVVTLVAIMVSILLSVSFITRQNEQYVSEQLAAMAAEYDSILEQYKAVAFSIVMDKHVQNYCSFQEINRQMNEEAGNVYNVLTNMLYMQNNANFIAIVNKTANHFTYNGNLSAMESRFESVWENDYKESIQAKQKGTLRLSFANYYYREHKYTLTLYFPVYSVTNMVTETGMVIINLNDSLLGHLNSRSSYIRSSLYLIDIAGTIVSYADTEEIGRQVPYVDRFVQNSGNFWDHGSLINYQRVGDWNYYLVDEVPARYLYQNCFGIIAVMLGVMCAVMILSLPISKKMAGELYRPMNKVISKMNDVSDGNLRTRINTIDMDNDSLKLADGFNSMMDEIDILMKQVAEEQRQIAQMRFDGLQSQIQPHFLYNTLECIHWQALADGSRDVSTMVKALAQYYRICLSDGCDIISLEKELEHVKNYMIIQNMRYDNIIELEIHAAKEYFMFQIPKITLQPLVENSIYHGIRIKEGRKGRIMIYIQEKEGELYVTVEDNGQGMTLEHIEYINCHISEFDQKIGYGVNNVNKRIELLYGAGYGLHYSVKEEGGVRVDIKLPKLETSKHI